jgi:hypothetical protein
MVAESRPFVQADALAYNDFILHENPVCKGARPWPGSPLKQRPSQKDSTNECEKVARHTPHFVEDHRKRPGPLPLTVGLSADGVEPWQRFPYLLHGYRQGGSHLECLLSLFSLHNETVNAWTTFFSVVMGLVLFADTVSNLRCSWLDFSPFAIAWIGQTLHGPLSCGYHTFLCMVSNFFPRAQNVLKTVILSSFVWEISSQACLCQYLVNRMSRLLLLTHSPVIQDIKLLNK